VRLVKTLLAVTSCTTPEGLAVLEVSDAGPWAKPPGRAGTETVVFGVWMVMVGWPIVQGASCIVIATSPGRIRVPPMPKPAPPAVGVRGKGTWTEQEPRGFDQMKQIFHIPDTPIDPPEIPEKLPLRFCASVHRKLEIPSPPPDVSGRTEVEGPKLPPGSKNDSRWKLPSLLTCAVPAAGTTNGGSVAACNASVPVKSSVAARALPAAPNARHATSAQPIPSERVDRLI
jgi:hypothetical protein